MSHEAREAVWEQSRTTGNARVLMLALAEYTHPQKGVAWPSLATLARRVGVTRRAVRRLLRQCEAAGELRVLSCGCGRGHTSRYRITLLDECPTRSRGFHTSPPTPAPPAQKEDDPDAKGGQPPLTNGDDHDRKEDSHGAKGGQNGSGKGDRTVPRKEIKKKKRKEREREGLHDSNLDRWCAARRIPLPRNALQQKQLQHPAVRAWLAVTERWPGYTVLPFIIEHLGKAPDEAVLRDAWSTWTATGYRHENVAGVIEWYQNRGGGAAVADEEREAAQAAAFAAQAPAYPQEVRDEHRAPR